MTADQIGLLVKGKIDSARLSMESNIRRGMDRTQAAEFFEMDMSRIVHGLLLKLPAIPEKNSNSAQ